jgi:hypothetical protein
MPRPPRAVLAVVLLALWASPALLAARPGYVERVFTLRHRKVEEAALLVRPLLSDGAFLTMQPRLNTLVVRDSPGIVERCSQAIASFDVPPRTVVLSVTLLKAGTPEPGPGIPGVVSEEIRGVGERLRKLFNFMSYTPLDALVVQGTEGDAVAYTIGGSYRLAFVLDPSADATVVRLKDLVLERLRRDEKGRETKSEILRTSINVPMGQTNVLGIGRDEAATGALFLVFSASPRLPGPGMARVR